MLRDGRHRHIGSQRRARADADQRAHILQEVAQDAPLVLDPDSMDLLSMPKLPSNTTKGRRTMAVRAAVMLDNSDMQQSNKFRKPCK